MHLSEHFMQQRELTEAQRQKLVVFFGYPIIAQDFYIKWSGNDFVRDGVVRTKLVWPFLENQEEKVYVQHLWLEQGCRKCNPMVCKDGAHSTFCGDADFIWLRCKRRTYVHRSNRMVKKCRAMAEQYKYGIASVLNAIRRMFLMTTIMTNMLVASKLADNRANEKPAVIFLRGTIRRLKEATLAAVFSADKFSVDSLFHGNVSARMNRDIRAERAKQKLEFANVMLRARLPAVLELRSLRPID